MIDDPKPRKENIAKFILSQSVDFLAASGYHYQFPYNNRQARFFRDHGEDCTVRVMDGGELSIFSDFTAKSISFAAEVFQVLRQLTPCWLVFYDTLIFGSGSEINIMLLEGTLTETTTIYDNARKNRITLTKTGKGVLIENDVTDDTV